MSVLVIATHNRKKAGEMTRVISRLLPGVQLKTLADFPEVPEPEETGTTYRENAMLKADAAAAATGLPCIADDSGLEIDAMNGEPGLYSKRFGGESLPFPDKIALILERLRKVPPEARTARFRCLVALAVPGRDTVVFESTCEGAIAFAPQGEGGFGYDPVFLVEEAGRTMAELNNDEKDQISHRGKVLRKFAAYYSLPPSQPSPIPNSPSPLPASRRPAAFLDRDGVINRDHGYVFSPEDFEFIEGAIDAIRLLNEREYYVFVVTNQSGIARGYYSEAQFLELSGYICDEVSRHGGRIHHVFHCPHHPDGVGRFAVDCDCRKPKPGMILEAARRYPVDLARSFLIGNKSTDIEAAQAAGINGHLFQGGNLAHFVGQILQRGESKHD